MEQVEKLAREGGFGFMPIGKVKVKRARYLIKDVLLKEVFTFISALAKAGKTTLALHLAICLTTGRLFLNRYPVRRCKVLYICLEDHLGEVKQKVKYMLKGKQFPKHLYLLNTKSLSLPTDFQKLEADIEKSKAEVVIFDTFRRSHSCEENSSTEMAPILSPIRKMIRDFKFAAVIIHHAGREVDKKDNPGDWLRGSSDFNGVWEGLIALDRQRDKTNMRIFRKYASDFNISYKIIKGENVDKLTGDFPIVDLHYIDVESENHTEEESRVYDILKEVPVSANTLEDKLKGKLSRPKIDSTLQRLLNKDRIKRKGKGKNTTWYAV